jgi:hypothetical protein
MEILVEYVQNPAGDSAIPPAGCTAFQQRMNAMPRYIYRSSGLAMRLTRQYREINSIQVQHPVVAPREKAQLTRN